MIVECPRCRARYRVESDLVDRDQTFKCSRCSHIFAHEAEIEDSTVPSSSTATPAEEATERAAPPPPDPPRSQPDPRIERRESLSFSFSGEGAAGQPEREPRRPPIPPERTRAPASEEGEFAFADDEEHVDESTAYAEEERPEALDDEPRFVRGEDSYGTYEAPRRSGRSYLLFLATVVLVYAILALDLSNDPARAEKLVAAVPIVGDMLGEDRLLQTRVQLQDVEGRYQQIKDDKLVFIISGRAINGSRDSLKGVQIESALYDASGKPIETKSIFCGNAMSLKIVKDLSSKEISLLQGLEPPKRFEIRPGESAGFSVVFEKPPAGVKEFSARVVAALPTGA